MNYGQWKVRTTARQHSIEICEPLLLHKSQTWKVIPLAICSNRHNHLDRITPTTKLNAQAYESKGVIYGLQDLDEKLIEIASSIGLKAPWNLEIQLDINIFLKIVKECWRGD